MALVPAIPEALATAAGFAGMALCVGAYAYTTAYTGRPRGPNPYLQHGGNLAGALLLVVSLLVDTNPASLVLESVWALIAATGLLRALMAGKAAQRSGA
ncbi:MAG TPA: permease [Novosphingobium sp.]|nr:permease [Novosphingobium sp.]